MPRTYPAALVWFRRDLRAHDNAALHDALETAGRVHCAFVFDRDILDALPRVDRRVEFIRDSLAELDEALRGSLIVRHAKSVDEIPRLARELGVQAVFANHDYEPGAVARDAKVRRALETLGIDFHTSKDHVIFERREILTGDGRPYSVFTPYKRAWLAKVGAHDLEPFASPKTGALASRPDGFAGVPALEEIGFEGTNLREAGFTPGAKAARKAFTKFLERIDAYDETRNFPAEDGTSGLSVHLRFGTVCIRELAREALRRANSGSVGAATWLSELVWRDFFVQVLANFDVADENGNGRNFRREFDRIEWESGARADELFAAWAEARTGYPIVDAAMNQLLQNGFMHNRLRMVSASFLVKDLGIDWRRGERFFAEKLNDYDLAANNGGWQWAAGTGCDAQPWFRIFNPESQQAKFDPRGEFIQRWLPGALQPAPIVDHAQARERTLKRFEAVKKNGA